MLHICLCVRAGARAHGLLHARACVKPWLFSIQRVRHIVTSFVAPWAPPHFWTLSLKRRDFRKRVTEHKMCVSIFCTSIV